MYDFSDDSDGSRGYHSDSIQFSPDSQSSGPRIEILEQPGDFRYRYEKEKYHGHILGVSSPMTKKKDLCKFPAIKVYNCQNDVLVRCWLISSNLDKPTAHFHKLARKLPKGETKLEPLEFFATDKNNFEVTCDYLHIVHAVMSDPKDVEIYERKKTWLETGTYECPKYMNVMNVSEGVEREELKCIDKNLSILYFEAYDVLTGMKLCDAVSRKIKNLHNPVTAPLKIVHYSRTFGSCLGGDEVSLFVEKITKDVEVRFFEQEKGSTERKWEARAVFGPHNVHHQYGIIFKTPCYKDARLKRDVQVFFELYRKTDDATSEPMKFTYKPSECCGMCGGDKPHSFSLQKRPHSPNREVLNGEDVMISGHGFVSKKSRDEIMDPDSTTLSWQIQQFLDSEDPTLHFQLGADLFPTGEAEGPKFTVIERCPDPSPMLSDTMPDFQSLLASEYLSSDGVPAKPRQSRACKKEEIPRVQMYYDDDGGLSTWWDIQDKIYKPQKTLNVISSEEVSSSVGEEEVSPKGIIAAERLLNNNFAQFSQKVNLDDVNDVDFEGNSTFLIASASSKELLLALLKCKGLDRSIQNLAGDNALLCAAKQENVECVEVLLKNGFDPNEENYRTGERPLHYAIIKENLELINVLLQHGANPLLDNYGSLSAYDYSCYSQSDEVKRVMYNKAQEAFTKQRKSNSTECDLVKELQTLKVSCT